MNRSTEALLAIAVGGGLGALIALSQKRPTSTAPGACPAGTFRGSDGQCYQSGSGSGPVGTAPPVISGSGPATGPSPAPSGIPDCPPGVGSWAVGGTSNCQLGEGANLDTRSGQVWVVTSDCEKREFETIAAVGQCGIPWGEVNCLHTQDALARLDAIPEGSRISQYSCPQAQYGGLPLCANNAPCWLFQQGFNDGDIVTTEDAGSPFVNRFFRLLRQEPYDLTPFPYPDYCGGSGSWSKRELQSLNCDAVQNYATGGLACSFGRPCAKVIPAAYLGCIPNDPAGPIASGCG